MAALSLRWACVGEMGEWQIHLALASMWKSSDPDCSPRLGKPRQCSRVFRHYFSGIWLTLHSSPIRTLASPGLAWVWLPFLLRGPSRRCSHSAQPACESQVEGAPRMLLLFWSRSHRGPQTGNGFHITCLSRMERSQQNCEWQGSRMFSFLSATCRL